MGAQQGTVRREDRVDLSRTKTPLSPGSKRGAILIVATAMIAALAGTIVLLSRTSTNPSVIATKGCVGAGRSVVNTPIATLTTGYAPRPASDTTFRASGTTWLPDLGTYPIDIDPGGERLCWFDGAVFGSITPDMTWEQAHVFNQPCLRVVATVWMEVDRLRCDGTDDGFRPRESETAAQNTMMTVRDTYFTNIHDDCLENDGVIGGLLQDDLWDGCFTGISERPSTDQGAFAQPPGETLTLDHMIIGLQRFPQDSGLLGENALFKWSASANDLVIECSVFKVDSLSVNGIDTMTIPGTIDDSGCPRHPSTLIWLGGGRYPAPLPAGLKVTSDISVWDSAVADWKQRHAGVFSASASVSSDTPTPSPS
ncbi:MAG: hypothetical protein M3P11_04505 [Actinomycetota bacterium]|nr:hypothetical protein [Actinomycetota bacterium]